MLFVRGTLISCRSLQRKKKDGSPFTIYQGFFVQDNSSAPTPVELGSTPLEAGHLYEIEVYIRSYLTNDGRSGYQLMRPKDGIISDMSGAKRAA